MIYFILTALPRYAIFLALIFATPAFSQTAETQGPYFEYSESKIGIDYRELAESPVAEMLSQGEAEFITNATSVFGDETAGLWIEMATEIGTGAVSNITISDMKEFTPNMLSSFSETPVEATKYRSLGILGLSFNSERFISDK